MTDNAGSQNSKAQENSAGTQGDIHVSGNVDKSVIVDGDNNIINVNYHAAEKAKGQLNTGWFFGHRYGDLAAFTGRADELKMLDEWLDNKEESLFIINAFGGFGKSALTWHWFNNKVDKEKWSTAVWWSFYEKESGFDSFLAETLTHLGLETKERSARQQVNDLLNAMQQTNILIVLDGFERLLHQYGRMDAALQDDEDAAIDPSQRDCTSQSAEIFLRGLSDKKILSKVLMTSRLFPLVLESRDGKLQRGCREVNLKGFSPDDAVKFFHAQEIKGRRDEIEAVCEMYGYHPLSLSLLVGLINEDHAHRGDIEAVKNLEIFEDVKARRHHVLQRAYGSLAPERRDLLSRISCFRGSMEYAVLKKVFPSPDLDKALLDLRKRGLLQYAGESQRYDMHPIVRHYAYDRFTNSERKKTHKDLAFHFIDVMIDIMPMPNTKVKTLEDLAPVIELYHHMVGAGNLDEAYSLFYERINQPTYYQFSAYQLRIELLRALFVDGEDKLPRLKTDNHQAWTLNSLANSYALSGQPRHAFPLYEGYISISEKINDRTNVVTGLGNMAAQQLVIGALSEAERKLRRQIDLLRRYKIEDELYKKAVSHQSLGRLLSYRGAWQEAEQELLQSQNVFDEMGTAETNSGSGNWAYRSLHYSLLGRTGNPKHINLSIEFANQALKLAEEHSITYAHYPRDYVRAYWLLGAAYRANNELTLAEENLFKALNLCRQINMVDHEADILLDVARLRYAQGDFKDAQEKASEALVITERSGYVLQGADVHLFLAELAIKGYRLEGLKVGSDKDAAIHHAKEALRLATCDGGEYKYKVAYDEAERMLASLNV